tara:strand:+ start:21468 stop:21644 length:177 start_codon:yes stop_codon:yes gene_type:complete
LHYQIVSFTKSKKEKVMERKFERNKKQNTPTNPNPKTDKDTNSFDIDKKTIKEQQNKK